MSDKAFTDVVDCKELVSVVCVFHNAAKFIKEALESVEAQTYNDIEVILVDDGSTDDSARLAEAWAHETRFRARLVRHPGGKNLGISSSRNLGLSLASGRYLAFIDADDVWAPEKLADQVSILRRHPALDLVCGATLYWASWNGGVDRIVPTGHVQNVVVAPREASLNLYPLGYAPSPCPSDFLVRREPLLAVGGSDPAFRGHLCLYEDQSMLAKLYLRCCVLFSDQVWVKYRLHAESCSAKVVADGRYAEVRAFFLQWYADYLRDCSLSDPKLAALVRKAQWSLRHPILRRLLQKGAWIKSKGVASSAGARF